MGQCEALPAGDRHSISAAFRRAWGHRNLIVSFAIRDLKSKYVGSLMGIYWSVMNPLLMMAVYTYVFSFVLGVRWGEGKSAMGYVLYLLCGMLPWIAFQESISRSCSSVVENGRLLSSYSFPAKIIPLSILLSALVNQLVGTVLLVVLVAAVRTAPGLPLAFLPFLLIVQVIMTAGIAWLVSAIYVFVRDIGQITGVALTVWMFMTPIFYPEASVPERLKIVVLLNPLSHLMHGYRSVLLEGSMPDAWRMVALCCFAVTSFITGYLLFEKGQPEFVDHI